MTLRVLIIGPYPRSRARIDGGVSAATMYLSESLSKRKDIELVGVRLAGRKVAGQPAGDLGWPVVDLDLGRFSVSTMFRRQRRQFRSLLQQFKPDIVHAQGADAAGYIAVRSGHPSIVTLHGVLSECAKLRTNPVKRMREQLQARITEHLVIERANHIVAISPYIARHYSGGIHGVLHDIPNAVAPAFYDIVRTPERRRFLFAGRISKGKGLLDLVRAVEVRRQSVDSVVVAGASPEPDFDALLKAQIARAGLGERIRLVGLLDERALLDEFSRATALVLPSYQETAPMVIQQAMAAGLPVIASRVGGVPDQIEDGVTGLLFDAGNVDSLGRLMARLGDDDELARQLASAARKEAIRLFTSEKVAQATVNAYESVIATAGNRG